MNPRFTSARVLPIVIDEPATGAPAGAFAMSERSTPEHDFSGLYRATIQPLRRYLARLLNNPGEAEEIAHDAFLRVYPTVQERAAQHPKALLYTTARRLALNRIKRRGIIAIESDTRASEALPSTQPGVVQQVIARQELQQLETAIAQLPAGCRAVLLLRKVELLSHQEIAQRLGIAISTVEKQHARALRLLRAALGKPGSLDPSTESARHQQARP